MSILGKLERVIWIACPRGKNAKFQRERERESFIGARFYSAKVSCANKCAWRVKPGVTQEARNKGNNNGHVSGHYLKILKGPREKQLKLQTKFFQLGVYHDISKLK